MIKVVICGSYHRDSQSLRRIFKELEVNGCRILSPISLDFIDENEAVVKTANENDLSIEQLELFHLRAIRDTDFIWLHCPIGHVGISGSYELGYANALKKPIFCNQLPRDEMLQTRVRTVNSIFEALEELENIKKLS